MHIFYLHLTGIMCDVICNLGQEGAVRHLCNWIRFKRQLNLLSPVKLSVTGHDCIFCLLWIFQALKMGIWTIGFFQFPLQKYAEISGQIGSNLSTRRFINKHVMHKLSIIWHAFDLSFINKSYLIFKDKTRSLCIGAFVQNASSLEENNKK